LIRVAVAFSAVALTLSSTAGALAAGESRAAALDCQSDLKTAKESLVYVNGLLPQKVIRLTGAGTFAAGIVTVEAYTRFVTLEYISGKLSAHQLSSALFTAARAAKGTHGYLLRLAEFLKNKISDLEAQCGGANVAASSTTPGSTATNDLTLTMSFQGVSEKRDEKTDAQTPTAGVTASVQSGSTYSGNVSVAGAVPAGDAIYVVFGTKIVAVLGPGGGRFSGVTEPKGFGADTTVGAFVCKQGASVGKDASVTTGCLAEGDDISVQWIA